MQNTQNTSIDFSFIHFISLVIAVIVSFAGAMISYEPLASLDFDFIFFENISISKAVGSGSNIVQYVTSLVFCVLTGISYYICVKNWKLPPVACLPLAFIFGVIGFGVLVIAIGLVLAVLATIVLIYGLFFGPGDR